MGSGFAVCICRICVEPVRFVFLGGAECEAAQILFRTAHLILVGSPFPPSLGFACLSKAFF